MARPSVIRRLSFRIRSAPRTPSEADAALLLHGSLRRIGWTRSATERAPVDADGRPLPWYAYPAIFWLDSVLSGTERVFEYGSGNSTAWYAERVRDVTSVEHDLAWARRVRTRLRPNSTLIERACGGDESDADPGDPYVRAVAQGHRYDVVVVDGMARNTCVRVALDHLEPGGLVLLDNSDRPAYAPSHAWLAEQGLLRIDFVGLAPGSTNLTATSVFCRDFARWLRTPRGLRHWGPTIPVD